MKTFMFPGQGSQQRGMGGTLFDELRELTAQADEILGYSIKELCLNDPRGELNRTQFTQPALYVVNALSYFKKRDDTGREPDYLAGHSLGEFNALMAADAFDFATGLRLVHKRGELMSQASGGGMAAVLNASREQILDILAANNLSQIDLANYNTPAQIVISGAAEEIGRAQAFFQQGRMLYYPLNTSGAFHSRFMGAAQEQFAQFLQGVEFRPLRMPVIANITARPYEQGQIAQSLASQISGTVRWYESVEYLLSLENGAGEMQFEEIGHGNVLKKLDQAIRRQRSLAAEASSTPAPRPISAAAPMAPPMPTSSLAPKSAAAPATAPPSDPAEKVAAWNRQHPVGTRVRSKLVESNPLETRTTALLLFGHRAAVYLRGYNGYFDLDELEAA